MIEVTYVYGEYMTIQGHADDARVCAAVGAVEATLVAYYGAVRGEDEVTRVRLKDQGTEVQFAESLLLLLARRYRGEIVVNYGASHAA